MELTKNIELNNMGVQHFLNHELGKAKDCYESAIALDPNDPTALNNLGLLFHHQKYFDSALSYFRSAISIKAKPNFLINSGNSFAMLGKYSEAKTQYLEAIKIAPDHISGWVSLAKLATYMKAYDEAISHWQKAIQLDEKEAYIFELAKIYIVKNEFETALDCLAVISNRTDNPEIWFQIGRCEFRMRNHGLAERAFKKALSQLPDRLDYRQYLALNHIAMGETQSGLQQFEFLLKLNPENYQAITEKGVILCSMELFDEAKICFEQALSINKHYAKAIHYKSTLEALIK